MKLTQEQLRQIICEEIDAINEVTNMSVILKVRWDTKQVSVLGIGPTSKMKITFEELKSKIGKRSYSTRYDLLLRSV